MHISAFRSLLLPALLALALAAGACTSGDDSSSETTAAADPTTTSSAIDDEETSVTSEPASTDVSTSETGGFSPAPLDWSDCDALECATLLVPLDYAKPDGEMIEIAVARQATAGGDRIGSVVLNPGGPGGSGIEYLQFAALQLPADLQSRFDLVSFDPRGVADSSSVDCNYNLDDDVEPVDTSVDAEWEALVAADQEDLADCEGLDIAPYLGTNNAARDMDVLREALGDEKLTYIGYSYGTRLGATYAELFPQNVRALVLDAAVLPNDDTHELSLAQAAGFDLAFENFAAACDSDPDCLLQDVGPTIDIVQGLASELDDVGTLDVDGGRQLTPGELTLGIAAALYSVDSWPILVEGLFVADTLGDGTILQFLADSYLGREPDGSYANQTEANIFINCADAPARPTLDEVRTQTLELAAQSQYFSGLFSSSTDCSFAPDPVDPIRIGPAEGAPPILVIGNSGDPATPYEWSVALSETLSSGVLYTVEAEGHTAYGSFDCLAEDVTAYLVDLTVPENRACSANATIDFFPPSGESDFELIVSFFDCLIDEGVDIEPITTADILADPTGEELFAEVDTSDPEVAGAILACQSFLLELSGE